ncbi:lipoyl(octanoyl) transferase LipB [Corynebacterium sp.]|uniref:lipoyl(octanoyl) transferase LipB n=1 Tax=Corynebacterium sp. TaxID=1720 RepID=UPI003B3AEAD1
MGYQHGSIRMADTPVTVDNIGTVDYLTTWDRQADLARRRAEDLIDDTVLLLEHPPTYTAGKRTQPEDLPTNGLPVVDVDRGGRITWHGPGQLVAYPIIKLDDPIDVVDYVRRIEEAVLATCREIGLDNVGRVPGRSGVWLPAGLRRGELVPARKVAAVGIRVTRSVTMHGVALNCDNTLEYYDHIVPCGLADTGVTTLSEELGRPVGVAEVTGVFTGHLLAALDGDLAMSETDVPDELAHGVVPS